MKRKNYLLLLLTSILFIACFQNLGLDYEPPYKSKSITFSHYWNERGISYNSTIIHKNDTLKIKKFHYLLSNIFLSSNNDTIKLADYKVIKLENSFSKEFILDSIIPSNTYKIHFTFGLKDINQSYSDLNAQNFNTPENGYYFMKFDTEKIFNNLRSNYNYHIAIKSLTSNYVNSFDVVIENFKLDQYNGYSGAKIAMNLNNLFSNPNSIDLNDLNQFVIQDSIIQTKMIENVKNTFYLERFF